MGIADIVTDGIACARLLHSDVAVVNEGYRAAYLTILCFGTVCTAVSLAYRLRNAHLMRAHVRELSQVRRTGSASAARRQANSMNGNLSRRTAQKRSCRSGFSASRHKVPMRVAGQYTG